MRDQTRFSLFFQSLRLGALAFIFFSIPSISFAVNSATAPTSAPTDTRTGEFSITFDHRSPVSTIKEQLRRFGWRWETMHTAKDEGDYDLSKESFDVRVPDSYKPDDQGWGVIVWVSPMESGRVPRKEWLDLLDSHKFIWIGADNAGNNRAAWCRIGLAIDAAYNLQQHYKIDPTRIYVSGMSGGSKIASLLGLAYPDVFAGGIYCCGVSYFKDIEAPPPPGEQLAPGQRRVYPKACLAPPLKLLNMTRQLSRHVLLTGEHDMNREPTQAMYEKGFKPDGFKHVTYLEVPDMGHQLPPAEWFEKALIAVDAKPNH
jgi:predicted esterase